MARCAPKTLIKQDVNNANRKSTTSFGVSTGNGVAHFHDGVPMLGDSDTLAPTEYLGTFRRKTHFQPEMRLMLAVLEDAVECFQKNVLASRGKRKRHFDETESWILDEADDSVFSFEQICGALGLNHEYVRNGLIRWKHRKLSCRPETASHSRRITDEGVIIKGNLHRSRPDRKWPQAMSSRAKGPAKIAARASR